MWSKRNHILLIFSFVLSKNNAQWDLVNENENLAKALSLVVQHAFIRETQLQDLIIYSNVGTNTTGCLFDINDLTDRVLRKISNATYEVLYNRQQKYVTYNHNELVLLDSIATFKYFFREVEYSGSKGSTQTLLFISSMTTLDHDTAYLIFRHLYIMEITKMALVIKTADNDLVLLTYFPFTATACRNFEPVIINHYLSDEHRWMKNEYFPHKMHDFYGCPIYCCAWENMPFFGAMSNEADTSMINYRGFEMEQLQYIASALNATIKIHWMQQEIEEIEKNGQFFTMLFSNYCDLAIRSFPHKVDLEASAFSQTTAHYFSLVCIITNVLDFHGQYEKLAFPFKRCVWLTLVLTCTLISLFIWTCERSRKLLVWRNFSIGSANRAPLLNFYALGVGHNMKASDLPKRNFARFVLMCWILLMFIMRVAYQSGMYHMLRYNTQYNPAQTITSLIERNYLITTIPRFRQYLDILPADKHVKILNTTISKALTAVLNSKEPTAFVVPEQYVKHFSEKNSIDPHILNLMKQNLLTQPLTIYVRRNSYMLRSLNKVISYARNYGFTYFWSPSTNFVEPQYATETPLSMDELGAIFKILMWLHLLAFIVFLTELIWHRYGRVLKASFTFH